VSKIIGIYGGSCAHDACSVYMVDGKIKSVIQEERPRRVKVYKDQYASPILSLHRIEKEFGIKLKDVDWICTASPMGIDSKFLYEHSVPKEKIFIVNHHESHCYGAYYTSGFNEKTLVASYDAGGLSKSKGYKTTFGRTYLAENGKMSLINSFPMGYTASIPCMYAAVTRYLGWIVHKDEGKVTGLAGHGEYNEEIYKSFETICWYDKSIKKFVPNSQAESATGINHVLNSLIFNKVLNLDDEKSRADLAFNMQYFLENKFIEYLNHMNELYPEYKKVALAGGVFANVKLNQRINELDWIDETYIYPAMNDAGNALGSVLAKAVELGEWKSKRFKHLFYGSKFSQDYIDDIIQGVTMDNKKIKRVKADMKSVASYLNDGNIIGWFKGRFEFGPRALGARSVLVRPTDAETHEKLNKRLGRNEVMPFAPIVLGEKANEIFVTNNKSHYTAEFMTMCYDTREEWIDKIPAVVHKVDKSARPQLVFDYNPFYEVLVEYEKLSNIPVLLNTSFNVHGEPIIDGPDQAIKHLVDGVVDYLVMEDFVYYVE